MNPPGVIVKLNHEVCVIIEGANESRAGRQRTGSRIILLQKLTP